MDWFKIWPSSYLNVIGRISDGALRGPFALLIFHCLHLGSLPDDDEEIAFLTGMPLEQITSLRPYLKRLARMEDGKITITVAEETMRERQDFAAKKSKAGEAGGKQKQANKEHVKEVLANPSTASEKMASSSNSRLCLPVASQTNKHTCIQAEEVVVEKNPGGYGGGLLVPLPITLSQAVAETMGMADLPEGGPGELFRLAVEEFRLAGVPPEDVGEFAKEWYARKMKNGQNHIVLSLPFLRQDLPGWSKAKQMRANGAEKAALVKPVVYEDWYKNDNKGAA